MGGFRHDLTSNVVGGDRRDRADVGQSMARSRSKPGGLGRNRGLSPPEIEPEVEP